MSQRIYLDGASGCSYIFFVDGVNSTWLDVPCVYAMLDCKFVPKYIGEAESAADRFGARMGSHERWADAQMHGACFIATVRVYGGVNVRRDMERDLIRLHNPPCNVQHAFNGIANFGLLNSPTALALRKPVSGLGSIRFGGLGGFAPPSPLSLADTAFEQSESGLGDFHFNQLLRR